MPDKSTIQLLRFPFSFFLLPVYLFALSFVHEIEWGKAFGIFAIIHFLVYPSSNGYNSYMDRDTESIGGVERPMQPLRELFVVTLLMDILAVLLSTLLSPYFALGIMVYIFFSRIYSYRGIRLKQFPVIGYLTVIINQGALIFALVFLTAGNEGLAQLPWAGMLIASLLIGGFYPITQVYQHRSDAADNVRTLSMMLGKRGTFVFCGVMYTIAFSLLFFYYRAANNLILFLVLQLYFIPVIIYFIRWFLQVLRDENLADFKRTMQMNLLAGTCTNLAFITIIILKNIG